MAIPVIVFTVLACVCAFYFWYKKRRDPEKSYSNEKETKTSVENPHNQTNDFVRNNTLCSSLTLQVHPRTLVTQHSTTSTSLYGETPADEAIQLLPPSSRNHAAAAAAAAANSPAPVTGAMNPGYHSSPTTPYSPDREPMRPLLAEPSAAAAASTSSSDRILNSEQGGRDQHEATTDELVESHSHIYDELKPPFKRPLPKIPESEQQETQQTPLSELLDSTQQTINPAMQQIQNSTRLELDKQILQALILNHNVCCIIKCQ